jgi:bifunctional DNA-binding transcriptional regulator/antitoxin component of YhaV-PrlF toxin-antitoxin module
MSTLTVTAKGQITLSGDILEHLGVQSGGTVAVGKLPGGRIEMRAAQPKGKISDAFDFLKKKRRSSLSIEEINTVAARGWTSKR